MPKIASRDENDLVDESPPGIGHNSIRGQDLEKICSELEAIAEQKKNLAEAQKDIMTVAKSKGFQPVHIREGMKLRAMNFEKRAAFLSEREAYLHALGLV